jgi:hypothetical protein
MTLGSHEVIIDHFSTGWATDDTIAVGEGSYNVTYQWGIVSEGLSLIDDSKVALYAFIYGANPNVESVPDLESSYNGDCE